MMPLTNRKHGNLLLESSSKECFTLAVDLDFPYTAIRIDDTHTRIFLCPDEYVRSMLVAAQTLYRLQCSGFSLLTASIYNL